MGAGRYVGRVGALAVALGVGAAVTVGAGVAWADESGGSTSSAASKHSPHQKPHRHKAADSSAADSSPAASSAASSDAATDSTAPKTSKAKRSSHKSKTKEASSSDAGKRRSVVAAVAGKAAQSVAATSVTADAAAPQSHAVSVAASVAPSSVPAVSAAVSMSAVSVAAPAVVSSSAGAVSAASALSVLLGGGSGAPALAPVSWVVAAAARRELGSTKTESAAATAAVATGPVSVSAAVPVAGATNQKPVFNAPVVGAPDASGVVSGSVSATDADGDSLTYTAGKAGKGTVNFDSATGDFTYTPSAAAMHAASSLKAKASALSDSFTVKVSDGKGGTATQTVTVGVAPANAVPVVTADLVAVKTSSTGVVTGSIKVTDADKDSLTYSGSSDKGKVTVTSKGAFTFTPSAAARHAASADGATDADTTATVSVTVSDGHGGSQTQSVVVDITPKNSNPSLSVSVGSANASSGVVTGTVKVTDADKDSVTVSVDSLSTRGGTVSYDSATGKYSYTASEAARMAAGAVGASKADKADTFTVSVDDGHGGVVSKVITVAVAKATAIVNAPDSSGVVTGNVNVADANGDALTFKAGKPAKGTVTVDPVTGSFTYTPTAAAMHAASALNAKASALSDSFSVKVSDGHGGTVTQTVTVAITPANAAPTVTSDLAVTKTNTSTGVVTGSIGVTDTDKDSLKYTGSSDKGKVTVTSKGAFTFTPSAAARHAASADGATDADTTATVSVTVSDGHGGSQTQSVVVDIPPKNSNPSVSVSVGKANSTTGVVTGTIKATDADKDSVSVSVDSASAKGGLVTYDSATGKYTYTPTAAARNAAAIKNAPKADKSDTFTVSVDDGHGGVVNKVVTVSVSPKAGAVNTAPTNGHASVNAPDASTGVVTGTLSATDADGDALTFTANPTTPKGAVTISGATFVYTPTASARQQAASESATAADKSDSFTVTVSDGRGGSSTFSVNVTVAPAVSVPTTVNNLGTKTVSGGVVQAAISADGTRVVVLTDNIDGSTAVTMFNANTGQRVGNTTAIGGAATSDAESASQIQFNSTGTRAVVTLAGDGVNHASISVFDTATGMQVGDSVDLGPAYAVGFVTSAGTSDGDAVLLNVDGTRGLVATTTYDEGDDSYSNRVHLIDITTGEELLATSSTPGFAAGTLSADGSTAAIVTQSAPVILDGTVDYSSVTTTVRVYDTTTGTAIGIPIQVTGVGLTNLNADGSRVVISAVTGTISTSTSGYSGLTSTIKVINTATGSQVGSTISSAGSYSLQPVVTPDGNRAIVSLMAVGVSQSSIDYHSSVVVINLASGNQVGSTITVSGAPEGYVNGELVLGPQLVDNGTRAVLMTVNPAGTDVTSQVALIDTATGVLVGQAVSLDGMPYVTVSADGSHLAVYAETGAYPYPGDDVGWSPEVTVIDAATGSQHSVVSPDLAFWATVNNTGSRLVVLSFDGTNTVLKTIDTAGGGQVGSAVTLVGSPASFSDFASYGDYLTLLASDGESTTSVVFVNVNTGTQIDTVTTINGAFYGDGTSGITGSLVADRTHAVVLTDNANGTDTDITFLSLT